MQEVRGSNPRLAHAFWCGERESEYVQKRRGHSELNQGPAGLQPDALPLSYIPRLEGVPVEAVVITGDGGGADKNNLSEVGFEPTPSYEDQNSHCQLPIREQGLNTLSLAP